MIRTHSPHDQETISLHSRAASAGGEHLVSSAHAIVAPSEAGSAPEWLHLTPAGTFSGADGRGPYVVDHADQVVAAMNGRKIPIDENHSIDIVGAKGGSTPARGWIVSLEARADGIWGRVEWTAEGRRLVESREYGFLSPVLMHTRTKPYRVGAIARVSLTNDPNLTSLTSLHTKEDIMDEELIAALGLQEGADRAAVLQAAQSAHSAQTAHIALMAKLGEIAGAAKDTKPDALITALQAKMTAPAVEDGKEPGEKDKTIADLTETVTSLQSRITQLATNGAKKDAEAFVDANKAKIVPALRDHMISRHMKNPKEVEDEVALMPSLFGKSLHGHRPPEKEGALSGEEAMVCSMMGLDPKAYAETAKSERGAV
ncbi:hypothetical protein DYI37_11440 [Fulvimarina endophytica]|uniref:Mu-like prophage I protein n=1 Tax=Fulvimarina endophytica TaxID=2293836 RepID=A0A371X301_9HYPH|nr:phage protease [Fulvimarina endophytica]RFC63611.1 hypothetical protein DYI37_11440 [Fulvimarina endophytica]